MEILTNEQLEHLTDLQITNFIRMRRGQEPFTQTEWDQLNTTTNETNH